MMSSADQQNMSDLIGEIYDCVLDPDRWGQTLASVCSFLGCVAGTLVITDLKQEKLQAVKSWNFEADLVARLPEFSAESAAVWQNVDDLWTRDLDKPASSMREAPELFAQTRWAREVMVPRGLVDSLHLIVLRNPSKIADIALYRSGEYGLVDDKTLARARLLAPHLRRAVAISNVLDLQRVEKENWKASSNLMAPGIVLVDADGQVVDMNAAAAEMIAAGWPVCVRDRRLAAIGAKAHEQLRHSIEVCSQFGGKGSGHDGSVILTRDDGLAMAHVLPIVSDNLERAFGAATAAVFISPGAAGQGALDAIGASFGLTQTEIRHLRYAHEGLSVPEAAAVSGVSVATANTHRQHIFRKLGVGRRAELEKMLAELSLPLRAPKH